MRSSRTLTSLAALLVVIFTAALASTASAMARARTGCPPLDPQRGLLTPPVAESPACARSRLAANGTRVAQQSGAITSKPRRSQRTRRRAKAPAAAPAAAGAATQAASPAPQPKAPPTRPDFTEQDQKAAVIAGIPDARFSADSEEDYRRVLGDLHGPWLALSAGGEDSAFGAGLLNGLSESGRRPDYAVVSGVSSGALLATFAFLGPAHDADLKREAVALTAADVFEDRRTPESLMDTWPLREFIAKRITPQLLAAVAAEHKRGRRLIVITTNLDTGRPVAWNMGAIAAAGTPESLALFRDVLMATSAIPGLFPPVLFDVEANGKHVKEMHVDGGLAATIYVAPDSMLLGSSAVRLPPSQITLVLDSKLMPEFAVTDRHLVGVLGRALSVGVKRATRSAATLISAAARRAGTEFNVAYVEEDFNHPSRGLFDPEYMKALFDVGLQLGRSGSPFRHAMPEATASAPAPADTPPSVGKAAPEPPPPPARPAPHEPAGSPENAPAQGSPQTGAPLQAPAPTPDHTESQPQRSSAQ